MAALWNVSGDEAVRRLQRQRSFPLLERYIDVGRIFIEAPSGQDHYWANANVLYQVEGNLRYNINRVADPDEVSPGRSICFSALYSGFKCWNTNSRYFVIYDGQNNAYRIEGVVLNGRGSACSTQGGDSGAPYFSDGAAFGIHSGDLFYETSAGREEFYGCVGTHIRYAEQELQVTVKTR